MMTLLAATRLMPSEPARVEMRNRRPLEESDGDAGRSETKPVETILCSSHTFHRLMFYLTLLVSLNSSAHFFLVVAFVEPSRR